MRRDLVGRQRSRRLLAETDLRMTIARAQLELAEDVRTVYREADEQAETETRAIQAGKPTRKQGRER